MPGLAAIAALTFPGKGFYAQTGGNFRFSGFLSIPAFFDRLGAVLRQDQDAGIGSGA